MREYKAVWLFWQIIIEVNKVSNYEIVILLQNEVIAKAKRYDVQ